MTPSVATPTASAAGTEALSSATKSIQGALTAARSVILGKDDILQLTLCGLLAGGHVLLEGVPGCGKTLLAHTLAHVLGLRFQRVQFTNDLLPGDILGTSVFLSGSQTFEFRPGPLFAELVLADEINRATPKTQSALLEAMEEGQVTVDGTSHALPHPFCVVATQNPGDQLGTYALPESQLDRFVMRLVMGFADARSERAILKGSDRRIALDSLTPILNPHRLRELQLRVPKIHVADPLLDYVQQILASSRRSSNFRHGLSTRCGLALLRCAQAWALIKGRDFVVPEDVQAVLLPVVSHRLQPNTSAAAMDPHVLLSELTDVAIP